jgi:hypothetical protein
MIQCFQMKTATVSDTKVSFSAGSREWAPDDRLHDIRVCVVTPHFASLMRATRCPSSNCLIPLSSPVCKNIFVSFRPKSPAYFMPSHPSRGALAIVTNVGVGCGGRGGAFDEQRQRVRRRRVVLTPRCWRQVAWKIFCAAMVTKKPVARESTI